MIVVWVYSKTVKSECRNTAIALSEILKHELAESQS